MMKEDRQFLTLFHLSQLSGLVLSSIGSFLVPLIIWILRKDQIANLDYHAKGVLNFQLVLFILSIISVPLIFIGVGVVLLIAIWVISIIFPVINTVKVSNGEDFFYPFRVNII